ncbi:MAG: hypothetical protein ACKOEG_00285, partial [Chthoniobacterales bacterium]
MKAAYLPLCILLIAGCASAPGPEVRTADPVKTIDIRSWPPAHGRSDAFYRLARISRIAAAVA